MAGTSFGHARLAAVVVLLLGFFPNPSLSAQVATGSIVDNRSMQLAFKVKF